MVCVVTFAFRALFPVSTRNFLPHPSDFRFASDVKNSLLAVVNQLTSATFVQRGLRGHVVVHMAPRYSKSHVRVCNNRVIDFVSEKRQLSTRSSTNTHGQLEKRHGLR